MPTDFSTLSLETHDVDATYAAAAFASDDGGYGPQGFLNADQRGVGTASNGKTSFSSYDAAKQMTGFDPITGAPHGGWGTVGQATTVTYAFRSTAPTQYPEDAGDFSRFSATQIVQAELALQAWSDVARITFERVGTGTIGEGAYSNSASMLFSNYGTGVEGASAFGMFPGSRGSSSSAGDVWINSTLANNQAPALWNYGQQTLLHEIGHAIGLGHPGEYDASDDEPVTYANSAEYYEDSRQYSVMSYFSESNTGASFGSGRYASAPLLDDITAAQIEYGANYATRATDTVYGFNSTAGRDWYAITSASNRVIFAVWDGGGNDTLDFSGYSQAGTIDLREGFFSSVGGLTGNVAIAHGAVIENARGGTGSDTMTGNASANSIFGGLGNDSISGGAGVGYLRGEEGNDYIVGGAAFDDTHGNMGNDTIYGGGSDDWVVGGKDNDLLYGEDGWDIVWGNLGNDSHYGGAGNDQVRGGQGDDFLDGGAGSDFVSGDRGSDTVYGGAGADFFHGSQDQGIDWLMDFNRTEGDRVMLDPGTTYSVAQVGSNVVLDMGGGNQMILVGVQMSSLSAGWIFESWTYG